MLGSDGISVNTWVNLDSSCSIDTHVSGDELQVEFGSGSSSGSLRLVLTEDMMDVLAKILSDTQKHFQQLDEEAESEH